MLAVVPYAGSQMAWSSPLSLLLRMRMRRFWRTATSSRWSTHARCSSVISALHAGSICMTRLARSPVQRARFHPAGTLPGSRRGPLQPSRAFVSSIIESGIGPKEMDGVRIKPAELGLGPYGSPALVDYIAIWTARKNLSVISLPSCGRAMRWRDFPPDLEGARVDGLGRGCCQSSRQ